MLCNPIIFKEIKKNGRHIFIYFTGIPLKTCKEIEITSVLFFFVEILTVGYKKKMYTCYSPYILTISLCKTYCNVCHPINDIYKRFYFLKGLPILNPVNLKKNRRAVS